MNFEKTQKAAPLCVLHRCNREGPISHFYARSHGMQEKTLLAGLTLGHLDDVLGKQALGLRVPNCCLLMAAAASDQRPEPRRFWIDGTSVVPSLSRQQLLPGALTSDFGTCKTSVCVRL